MKNVKISGFVKPEFVEIKQVFAENFSKRGDIGAACCIYYKGECVVDLWGGSADNNGRLWEKDTKVMVFSTIKSMAAMALAFLHSEEYFDYDDLVVKFWPEFGVEGKDQTSIRTLLNHEAGLCAVDFKITIDLLNNPELLSEKLAKQKPLWPPGNVKAYHAWTLGLYMNELCKRIDPKGRDLSAVFDEEIAQKLDVFCSIGRPSKMKDEELAKLIPISLSKVIFKLNREKYITPLKTIFSFLNPFSLTHKVLLNPSFGWNPRNFNKPEIQRLKLASAMGFGTARCIAKIFSEFANQTPTLNFSKRTLAELEADYSSKLALSLDPVLGLKIPVSLGMAKTCDTVKWGNSPRSYGNSGTGGSSGFADPDHRIGFSYVMNRLDAYIVNDAREFALRKKLYEILGDVIA